MEKIFKLIAQMVGMVILAGLLLLALWGIIKLFIFLITIFSIVIGVALALIIAVGLIVVLFQTIKEILYGKDKNKKTQ
jgi:hypothetical protein